MPLSPEQHLLYERLKNGHDGEMNFFKMLKSELTSNPIILFNLLFDVSNSECEIDCLLIFQQELHLFEIKNYQGDFFVDNDQWYTLSKKEIKNPLHQLQRTEVLLSHWLKQHKLPPFSIHSHVVFVHPEFYLYDAPVSIPAIFPGQIKRFISKLNQIPCHLNSTHERLKSLFVANQKMISAYERSLSYEYELLKKGVICGACDGVMGVFRSYYLKCLQCAQVEKLESAVRRNVDDFYTLFPGNRITVSAIYGWLGGAISKFRIRKILSTYCHPVKLGSQSYYLYDKDAEKY